MFGLLIVFDHTRRRKAKADMWREMLPEDLMVLAMIGGVGFPISMLWLCWSAQYKSVYCCNHKKESGLIFHQFGALDRADSGWHGSGDMPDADPRILL
jgi:hypothetical protein